MKAPDFDRYSVICRNETIGSPASPKGWSFERSIIWHAKRKILRGDKLIPPLYSETGVINKQEKEKN
jgi:hypothetical protein